MTLLHGFILGIVEGTTEFLPISSTGHLILVSNLLHIDQTDFQKSFEIIIQLGAIASVVVLYFKSLLSIATIKKLIVAFLPTGVIGLTLYKIVKQYLIGNEHVVVWSLLAGGIALIAFEMIFHRNEHQDTATTDISYRQAFYIGLFQSVAIIPGVSRSAATIVGGMLLGLPRRTIVEFSFLLAVPTMLAASGLDLIKNAGSFSSDQIGVLTIGFVTAFIVAMASIKLLLRVIKSHSFIPFGIYRIAIALLYIAI